MSDAHHPLAKSNKHGQPNLKQGAILAAAATDVQGDQAKRREERRAKRKQIELQMAAELALEERKRQLARAQRENVKRAKHTHVDGQAKNAQANTTVPAVESAAEREQKVQELRTVTRTQEQRKLDHSYPFRGTCISSR